MSDQHKDTVVEAVRISEEQFHPILKGLSQEMQWAIIAELLGTLLQGFPAKARKEVFEAHVEAMRKVLPELDDW